MRRDRHVRRHRQEDRDAVARADAERDEPLGQTRDVARQLRERQLAPRAVLAEPDRRDARRARWPPSGGRSCAGSRRCRRRTRSPTPGRASRRAPASTAGRTRAPDPRRRAARTTRAPRPNAARARRSRGAGPLDEPCRVRVPERGLVGAPDDLAHARNPTRRPELASANLARTNYGRGGELMQRFVTPENKKWWTLGAVSVGLFMIMLDNTVVNVALPAMQSSLHLQLSELEWVVAGYALTFAAFMLTGGKLADFLGRRLIFMVGLAIFTGASLACGLAPNGGFLIGARVVQGLGGALMNPATLSIITATFPPRQRGMAIGIWAGVSAMALAIGPLVGGLLTEHVNWNWIFFINVPDRHRRAARDPALHRRVARHVARAAARRSRASSPRRSACSRSPTRSSRRTTTAGRPRGSSARSRSPRSRSSRSRCSSGTSACRCSTSLSSATARSAARTRRCCSSASRCSGRSSTSRSTCRTCSATRRRRPARRSCR